MEQQIEFAEIAKEFSKSFDTSPPVFKGKGSFKETYRIKDSYGNPIALKILDPKKCNINRSKREIEAMKMCDSPFIAKLIDFGIFNSTLGDFQYLLEEYFDSGSLKTISTSTQIDVQEISRIGYSISGAIKHLKEREIVHRDIKPENIMYRDSMPVLVDFGLVRFLSKSSLTQSWINIGPGTPFFAAPEQLNNDKDLIDWRTDQFSLGLSLGLLISGKHPFQKEGMNETEAITNVLNKKDCCPQFIQQLKELDFDGIGKMIKPWPIQRFQSPDIIINYFKERVDK